MVVCQVCGRAKEPITARADGWLIERWRVDPAVWVVRCYAHISEWALRASSAGRTQEWRQAAQEGRERALEEGPTVPPVAQIMAVEGRSEALEASRPIDYGPWWALEEEV